MCKSFVAEALNQTLTAEGVFDIINYQPFPWGNAYYNTSECGTAYYDKQVGMTCWLKHCGGYPPDADCFEGKVLCQHGDVECTANRVEACAVVMYPNNVKGVSEFMWCMEGNDGRLLSLKYCANMAGLEGNAIQKCFSGTQGDQAMAKIARATAILTPAHLGTPWVIVNGQTLNDPSTLLTAVCAAYEGNSPPGCQGVKQLHSRKSSNTTRC